MGPRNRILGYVRGASPSRPRVQHPVRFDGRWLASDDRSPVERFADLFSASGGEVERFPGLAGAARWLREFSRAFDGVALGVSVPGSLRPPLPAVCPDLAPLGISWAAGAVAETGALVLDARDGSRAQLLAPTHVVFVRERDVHATLVGAMTHLRPGLPSAVGLHAGPSNPADIEQILVRGVHGPGRIVAALIGDADRG